MNRSRIALAALLLAALVLIGVEVARGRTTHPERVANPCLPRPQLALGGLDGTVQQIVLAGLDRAACSLRTTREALVLAIGGAPAPGAPRWKEPTITTAVRSGMLGAVEEAAHRGAVPAFAAPLLEKLVRHAPIDVLVRGGIDLRDLIG